MNSYCSNRYRIESCNYAADYPAFYRNDIWSFHRSLPGYFHTPLESLPGLAGRLGVGQVWVKDEAHRFGLKAFKALGASYAIHRYLAVQAETPGKPAATFCTATDGNHGRAVAWMARLTGRSAVVFMPVGSVRARIEAIAGEGAEVVIVDGDYDAAVRRAAAEAAGHGWQVIADTAYPGYMTIPDDIMAGYTTIFEEITAGDTDLQTLERPGVDVVIVQGGVGSFAAAAAWYCMRRYGPVRPRLVSVEPIEAACLLESARSPQGEAVRATGRMTTIMAGLNCGTPSLRAWPLLRDGIDLFLAVDDDYARQAMQAFYHPVGGDRRIISGESGSAGLAALLALCTDPSLAAARDLLRLDDATRVLVVNTEGDTDPEQFRRVVGE